LNSARGDVTIAAITLGSNLGDRHAHLDYAVIRLQSVLRGLRISRYHETVPVGLFGPQALVLNAAAVGETSLPARALLDELHAIEQARGRTRPHPGAARTLDLDLVLFGRNVIREEGLEVPHPRFRERMFVLEPLAEVGADLEDPVSGLRVGELLARLRAAGE
jgi:2-amino-4-hydroxy-6-hydroxymethyldihydropteridine diphosphokinase